MVGGNGPNVTWRLAARFADELNLDGLTPGEVVEALPVIAQRCEEIGRDPATLKVSVHTWYESPGVSTPGQGPGGGAQERRADGGTGRGHRSTGSVFAGSRPAESGISSGLRRPRPARYPLRSRPPGTTGGPDPQEAPC